jgi:hypothetical protein
MCIFPLHSLRKERAIKLRKMAIDAGLTQVKIFELSGLRTNTIRTMWTGNNSWNIDSEIIYINTILTYLNTLTN